MMRPIYVVQEQNLHAVTTEPTKALLERTLDSGHAVIEHGLVRQGVYEVLMRNVV
jgi:hypothetical protein